jgi:MoxR-like ATPase
MNFTDVLASAELIIESGGVPLLIGESGIGKTSLVNKLCSKNGFYCIVIDGNLLKEGEIGGLPTIEEYRAKEGDNYIIKKRTVYAVHKKLQEIDEVLNTEPDRTILLFIDEINRCEHSVQQELMNIILNREINGYRLPDSVKVAAAANPSSKYDKYRESEYQVVDMDPAQEDRFVWIEMNSDPKAWIIWGMEKTKLYQGKLETNVHKDILEFISTFPDYLDTPNSQEMIKATPRSWERVSDAYRIYINKREKISEKIFYNVVKGNVGPSIAQEFCNYIEDNIQPLLTPQDIFYRDNIGDEIRNIFLQESHIRLYLIARNLLQYLKENSSDKKIRIFSELLKLYPVDLRLGIMKEIKEGHSPLYKDFLEEDTFLEAFFTIYGEMEEGSSFKYE